MAAVQFILGRSGTGKTTWCIESVCASLASDAGDPLILLVPEQATYQAERAILSHPNIAGFSRLRILSFNRLQFWLQSGRASRPEISHTGRQMVLHKLLLEMSETLSLYGGPQQRAGLADKLSGLLTELQQSSCPPQQVRALAETLAAESGQELAAAKWADIARLFEQYAAFFQSPDCGFTNPDNQLKDAARQVANAGFLKNTTLWVDGFSGFSVQERDLLIELLKVAKQGHLALCLDAKAIDLSNTETEKLDPFSLFQATEQTYTDLLRIFKGCKFNVQPPVLLETAHRFASAPALAAIETCLFDINAAPTVKAGQHIQVAACSHVRAEAVWIAQTIRRLVKDEGLRYRDTAVVVPDINAYGHYIDSAFTQYGLPYFLDRPRNMKNHPLCAFIGSALQAVSNGFALPDVLSFLKSDFGRIESHQLDVLENYCRAFDVQGGEWLQKKPWDFAPDEDKKQFDEKHLDALRKKAVAPLAALRDGLYSQKEITAAAFTQALWQLLEEMNVQKTLAEWAADDTSDQRYGHRQMFGKLVELLDELAAIFADQTLPAESWASIVSDAMSTLTIKLIPPTLDQVLVGSIERSRHPDVKAIFLVGATQKQFPIPLSQENLLTEQDYQLAIAGEMELANPYQTQLAHRQYLTYIALTRPSQKLYISHPMLDEKGASIIPWSGIEQLQAMFTDLEIVYPQGLNADCTSIQTPLDLSQWLSANLGKDRLCDESTSQLAAGLLARCEQSDAAALKSLAAHVQQSLGYENRAALDPATTQQLFKLPLRSSVTRLGTFASCPFQYFARYTLKLDKRKLLKFEPMDIGTFYHAVLERMFYAMQAKGLDWATAEPDVLAALCDDTIAAILKDDTHIANFIRRNAHHAYIIDAAAKTIKDFTAQLALPAKAGVFKQTAAELEFAPEKDLQLTIKRGQTPFINFSGKIDRLDTADIDGKAAGVVFDFKRTPKSVNFAGMYYGLDVQLPVYLLAISKIQDGNMTPVGAFFLPIETGLGSPGLSKLGQTSDSFRNKAKGLFNGQFADKLDMTSSGGWNTYYNFYQGKDGPYGNYRNSGALKPDDFDALLTYTQNCVTKLAAELTGGNIDITPYRLGKKSPCAYCDYRPLCRFDWQINEYNILEACNKEQALEKMKEIE